MVDLHTHILPFLDDGAATLEVSLYMLKSMANAGVNHVVATPHFNLATDDLEKFLNERQDSITQVSKLIREENLEIELSAGVELMFSPELANVDLAPFTLGKTDYILIELSTEYDEPSLESTFKKILSKGFIPILAHVERYSYLVNNSQRIVDLISLGCLMQVNVAGITSNRYPHVKAMMKKNLIHLVGSDSHNMTNRKPNLNKNYIPEVYIKNNLSVIRNQDVDVLNAKTLTKVFNKYL